MSSSSSQDAESQDIKSIGSIPALVTALLVAIFAFQLNASMLSPVLATMRAELEATDAQIGVTQTAFFAAAALFSLFLPRWGDLVGRRRILMLALTCTFIGSIISAVALNIAMLAIGRIIQGVSGPIVPMALIMLHVQVPDNRKYAKLMAILTAVNGGIAGVDAIAGGWLAENYGFRSVFWTMAAVALIAMIVVPFGTKESRSPERLPMDWPGVVSLSIVLGSLYYAFEIAGDLGDANWYIVVLLLVVAAIGFFVFWRIETRSKHPLVTTTYMKERRTWALLLTTLLTMTGVFAIMNGLIPNLAQDESIGAGLGADVVSWWTLTPYALAGLVMGPIAGQLASRFGYKNVLQSGMALSIVGIVAAAFLAGGMTPALLLVISLGIGITYAGIVNIMLNGLGVVLSPQDNQGYLPGMNSGAFNLGAGLSFAILFGVFTVFNDTIGTVAGYRISMLVGAGLVTASLITSTLIPRPAKRSESDLEESTNV